MLLEDGANRSGERLELAPGRRVGGEEAFRQPDRAEIRAHATPGRDQLHGTAADVDDDRPLVDRADPTEGQLRLFLSGQQAGREAVAPLDLAEERLPVLGVPHRARRHEQGPLRAERLELAPVVSETVADARDRQWEQPAPRVDPLAEARDRRPPHDLVYLPVLDVCNKKPRRVRALIDRGYAHEKSARCSVIPSVPAVPGVTQQAGRRAELYLTPRRGVEQSGSSPGS